MGPEVTFTATMPSRLSYVQPFEENYDLYFVDVRVLGIVEDVMRSNFLLVNCRATYIH